MYAQSQPRRSDNLIASAPTNISGRKQGGEGEHHLHAHDREQVTRRVPNLSRDAPTMECAPSYRACPPTPRHSAYHTLQEAAPSPATTGTPAMRSQAATTAATST